jgi:O-antigen/teichoic acid export membrane protein
MYRVRGAIEWIVLVLLPLAIARQLSAERTREAKTTVAVAGLCLGMLLLTVVCISMLASPRLTATALFGGSSYSAWVMPFSSLLGGYCLALLANGILRGLFAFKAANIANVVSIAIIPTACLVAGRRSNILNVVTVMGVASSVATLSFLAFALIRRRALDLVFPVSLTSGAILASAKTLVTFGVPRIATVGFNALFAMAIPWLMARHGMAEVLATLNVMMAILAGAAVMTSPVGFVLLPHFSRSLASGEKARAATNLRAICSATVFVGITASIVTMGFAGDVLWLLFDKKLPGQAPLIAAVAVSVPLFLLVDISRSPLDAISTLPLNAITYLSGFVGAIVVFHLPVLQGVGLEPLRCAESLVAGYLAATGVCCFLLSNYYGVAIFSRADVMLGIIWTVSTAAWIALTARFGETALTSHIAAVLALAGCLMYLYLAKPKWLADIVQRTAK